MLYGKYRHTIDAKGRVIVPVRFREDLGDNFIVTKGLDQCLALYSMREWSVQEEKIKSLPLAGSREIQRFFFANAYPVELDAQGRIVIPAELREFAGLKKDVVVTGVSTRVEIWDSEAQDASEKAYSPDDIARLMQELGF